MILATLAVYCIGMVGDVQVVEFKGKSYFIKGHTVNCEWKSNTTHKEEVVYNKEERETLMFQNVDDMLASNEYNVSNNYITAIVEPTSQVDHLCPYGQHGWEWDIDNMENYTIVNRKSIPLKKWGFCTTTCDYQRLENGQPTDCSTGE